MQIANGNLTDWPAQLRRFRRRRGFKQAVLAEMIGVDQATISRWETGNVTPELRIQRRLIDLMRRPMADESLLKHIVNVTMAQVVLSDRERVIVAASASYCAAHGMAPHEIIGKSAHPMYNEESERCRRVPYEHGFYHGDVASIIAITRGHSLSGHERDRPLKAIWTPVRLSEGDILLRGERVTLDEGQFVTERERNSGAIRIVHLDDLIR